MCECSIIPKGKRAESLVIGIGPLWEQSFTVIRSLAPSQRVVRVPVYPRRSVSAIRGMQFCDVDSKRNYLRQIGEQGAEARASRSFVTACGSLVTSSM
jgi:hypothetical protein